MDKIVTSLREFKLTNDIKNMISSIDPANKSTDLSAVLRGYYDKDLIGESEYLALETKIVLKRFCLLMEQKFNGLMHGVYLYDHKTNKVWNASVPNIPTGYNEYSNGASVEEDIQIGEHVPEQMKSILAVPDVDRAEDLTSLNHKKDLMKNGIYAYCSAPLSCNGSVIGHTAMFSKMKRDFSDKDLVQYNMCNQLIVENLLLKKEQLIRVFKNENRL
ncbi:hypothetical protein PU629_12360 [Pullulanibacillus sp. KACC 23026]|uniref:GAF domain-containing protein n=1 Tax=Pullulanibacillus sp. KACC 23026 TaxID=3028315 RepID=UPI0023AE7DEF|nr:hypothetical protein [Pullulanibacillus sp. KACC 23026]WEG10970.1 hypothetical protein PU629_12360 [Pullulanibacillus sp. KACC 23026]